MARIESQTLFLTTSPRSPEKMFPEIDLLFQHFNGKVWNKDNQIAYMNVLRKTDFYNGTGQNDPSFSARDRINRAPKALGFVALSPVISVTNAGLSLLKSQRKNEIFLRQLMKFQIPSPYHKPTERATYFWVKPYLEILRLIRTLGTLKFDELQMFGMQLTDYHKFEEIVGKIEKFRIAKANNSGSYREFKGTYFNEELMKIYSDRITNGKIKTRESNTSSLNKFLKTQANNMRDYADACFRYLRFTELVNVSQVGKSLSIVPERIPDVDYILEHTDRNPCFVDDVRNYIEYLGNTQIPKLLTDNKPMLLKKLKDEFPDRIIDENQNVETLKDLYSDLSLRRKKDALNTKISEIKDNRKYDDIQLVYDQITGKELYDTPLMLEWNTWRAMTMLDGGEIHANLNFDDFGNPLSTAGGNMPDIVCDYGDFVLSVEVTMMSAQRQFESESEPISRHLGKLKEKTGKSSFCLFISPTINPSTIAFCYMLHKTNVTFYGGKSIIIPLTLNVFRKMLEDAYKAKYKPDSDNVKGLFMYSEEIVDMCETESVWFQKVTDYALNWLEHTK